MNMIPAYSRRALWSLTVLLGALAGCNGDQGRGAILGADGSVSPATAVADTTRPRVTATQPATTQGGSTPNVPANSAISAVFTEEMLQSSITTPGNFVVTCTGATACVAATTPGTVSYTTGTRTSAPRR